MSSGLWDGALFSEQVCPRLFVCTDLPGLPCSISPFPDGNAEPRAGEFLSQGPPWAWKAVCSFICLVLAGMVSPFSPSPLFRILPRVTSLRVPEAVVMSLLRSGCL